VVDVRNLPREVEAAADDGQSTIGADWVVEARLWGRLVGEHLPPRRQGLSRQAQRPGRMDKARPAAT
jgi:hypothetical protein